MFIQENVVHVGGMQIKDAKPLPEKLQAFMDAATEGAVLMSFGTTFNTTSMSKQMLNEFLRFMTEVNRPIVLKWDKGSKIEVPDNVFTTPWVPQQDLLAHPNLKVFVTHGGLFSAMEAIYNNVLLVGIPHAFDHRPVISRLQRKNVAILIEFSDLDADTLLAAVKRAFEDQSMAASMSELSRLFKDVPMRPVEKAAWWVEFVCRHKGADFLKPKARHLPWYKYYNLDICLAISGFILIVILGMGKLVEKLCVALYSCRNKLKRD